MDSLLSQNANYAKAKQDVSKRQKTTSINRMMTSVANVVNGDAPIPIDDLTSIERKYSAPIGANEQAYTQFVTQNEDVVSTGKALKQISNEINQVSTAYNDALKDLKKSYGGKLSAS